MEYENKPLTMEQLLHMDGQPVWIEDFKVFGIVCVADSGAWAGIPFIRFFDSGAEIEYNADNRCLKLYAHKLIDFEKWKPCRYCRLGICATCINHTTSIGEEPCAKCNGTSFYKPLSFCPYCGRPLTAEAREMLERRLRGSENG